jgi:hypothetical protein
MTEVIVRIDAQDLARVAPFVAKQDVRYYLNGIYVEPHADGAILTATNGHIAAALFSSKSFAAEARILDYPKRLAAEIRKAALARALYETRLEVREGDAWPEIVSTTGYAKSPVRHVEYVSPGKPFIDGRFPDWRKIIPAELIDGLPGFVNSDYVRLAVEAMSGFQLGKRRYHGVTFQHGPAPDSPIVIRSTDAPDLVVVIMPMRGTFDNKTLPDWTRHAATKASEPEKAAA